MKGSVRLMAILCALGTSMALGGCAAAMIGGSVVRSGKREVDFVLGAGATLASIQDRTRLAISVSGVDASNGQYVVAAWAGDANASVYSDMMVKEFMRQGYDAEATSALGKDGLTDGARDQIRSRGFDLILVGNLNLAMTSNYGAAMVGGEYMRTGVTSVTMRGVDPGSGRTLFMLSVEYGTAKSAATVAEDVGELYAEALAGKLSGQPASQRASTERSPRPELTPRVTSEPVAAAASLGPSPRPLSAGSLSVPVPTGPGTRSGPGPVLSDPVVRLGWQSVDGATGYAVFIRDLTSNTLVHTNERVEDVTSYEVPAGVLRTGQSYRWNVRARSATGNGPLASPLYFRR